MTSKEAFKILGESNMFTRRIATVGLIMLSAFLGGATMTWVLHEKPAHAQSHTFSHATWEYQRLTHAIYSDNDVQFQKELSQPAKEGWELMQINEGPRYSSQLVTYWKRVKTNDSR